MLRLHLDGEVVAFMRDRGEKVELRVRGLDRARQDISSVLNDPIALPGGGTTTFGALAKTRVSQGRGVINHHNYRRAITVEADIDVEVTDTVQANNSVREEWEKISDGFPNTDIDQSGELDDIQESLDAMFGLFLLGSWLDLPDHCHTVPQLFSADVDTGDHPDGVYRCYFWPVNNW